MEELRGMARATRVPQRLPFNYLCFVRFAVHAQSHMCGPHKPLFISSLSPSQTLAFVCLLVLFGLAGSNLPNNVLLFDDEVNFSHLENGRKLMHTESCLDC